MLTLPGYLSDLRVVPLQDPSLSIQMQSANGLLSRTCGLARNVPFTLGGVTILLQVHIMDAAPYIVLLGRPFDTITESRIVNDKKGNQTVCITYPNTGNKVAIPTYKRGELSRKVENLANFWSALRNLRCFPEERFPV